LLGEKVNLEAKIKTAKMKKALLLPSLLMLALGLSAQHHHLPCLYDLAVESMEHQYPGYKQQLQQTIKKALQEQRRNTDGEVYAIPVVVHVVWKEAVENIALERIEAQLRVLNESFRRQNADTVNTREAFHPVVGDAGIEFVLADVIRVQTNETFQPQFSLAGSTLPDKVKRSAQGGSDAVEPEHFLNIWVCAIRPLSIFGLESPVLGYAYPPAGLAHWPAGANAPSPELEGVVVDYRTFGDNLTYQVPGVGELPMRGRTTVHEVGHYLGLRHISGDGTLAILGIPDCNADDGVADTPNQGTQSQFDCNPEQNTCNDGPGDLPDMIENYMDYSRETCQNSFTKGQIEIMRAVLEGPRSGLPLPPTSTSAAAPANWGRVFPNPSDGLFFWDLPAEAKAFTFSVHDIYGRPIIAPRLGQPRLAIDLSGYPAGLYFLHAKLADGLIVKQKLVLQR
jgi:hypothetical protein